MGVTCIGQMILPSIKLVSSFDVEKPSDSVILEVSLPSDWIGGRVHCRGGELLLRDVHSSDRGRKLRVQLVPRLSSRLLSLSN